ncbi:LRRNT 2 domain-containing protein [Citrus sinensis]|nr:LRRNT 2 domain-containing protein [Citrus sinensis]
MKSTMVVFVALLFLELFTLVTMINISFCIGNPNVGCVDSERQALLKLKQDLSDPSNRLASWNIGDGDCCAWDGVVCNNFTGHVLQLNLGNPNPNYGTGSKLVGKINPSLFDLKHLIHLDLSDNDFQGIQTPSYLGSLKNLRYLNLSGAEFAGVIPHQLGNISNLQYLDLSKSYYELQVESISWLSGLSFLEHLDLSLVDLTKSSDGLVTINSLPSLKVLKLSSCELHHFPSLPSTNFSSLKALDLSGNHFNNSLFQYSSWVFGLRNLVFFDLSDNEFHGKIPSGLGNLTFLRHLDLSSNEFNSAIPGWLSKLNDLEFLSLRGNSLHGTISSMGLEKLTSIKTLDLSFNVELGGQIPTSFVRLCKLTSIDVSYVKLGQDLSQVLDIFSSCGAYALESLVLSGCHICGHLTNQLGQFKSLHTLELRDNSLSGPLPPALGELSSMKNLDLFNNTLDGAIPMSLGQLSHLELMDLSNNRLNGTLSEIHFVNLTKLTSFSAFGNSLIFKVNQSWVPPFQLEKLRLRSCHLGPQFPSWLRSQKHLFILDISNTRISDTIPRWFWNSISQYVYLNLSTNQIYGEIPNCDRPLPLVPSPGLLDLSNNALSGSIFHLICNNFFSGSLPISIGTLSSLELLNLRNNRMVGIIPVSIQNCSNLKVLDMGENEFVGDIPIWMGEDFQVYRFSIFDQTSFMANSSNQDNAISYIRGGVSDVFEDASVVTKGFMVEYNTILNLVRIMDISNNNFSGEVPKELTNLMGLQSLNFSHNLFTGKIPENIGNMRSIESLDFSMNQLSGKVPQSMSSLSFLNHLNLSYNNLTGKIPSSTQLQSMDASSFAGNNLCGAPLPNCPEKNALVPEDRNENGNEDEDEVDWLLYVSMALGFVLGFWCFMGPLLINRRWRYKYCYFLDGCVDRFGCPVRKCY